MPVHLLQLNDKAGVTEVNEIMKFGVMVTPGLAIDGQVKVTGKVADVGAIKKMLSLWYCNKGPGCLIRHNATPKYFTERNEQCVEKANAVAVD